MPEPVVNVYACRDHCATRGDVLDRKPINPRGRPYRMVYAATAYKREKGAPR